MLRIRRTGGDIFTATAGEQVLGWCRYRSDADTTEITGVFLTDPEDDALLDGLVRLVLFAGQDAGRRFGRIADPVFQNYGGALRKLGFQIFCEKTAVLAAPKQCGCGGE